MLKNRLKGIIEGLKSVHDAGIDQSDSTKGSEREAFINTILKSVIAPPFRIGSGDVIDNEGNRSGQQDIVIEHGGGISFPLIAHETPRLYLAESVCAVVEVKSSLEGQWDEVESTALKLHNVKREPVRKKAPNNNPDPIPLLVVGYRGWKRPQTYREKLRNKNIAAILSIDPPIFEHNENFSSNHGGKDEMAIFGFVLCLESATSDYFTQKPPYAKYKDLLKK